MKTTSAVFAFAVLSGIVGGCASADSDSTSTGGQDVVVGVLDLSNKVTVKDDTLEFDGDLADKMQDTLAKVTAYAAAGDKTNVEPVFLIGNRQADAKAADGSIKDGIRNPLGYLRRAVSWSRGPTGTIVVKTEPATIAEASAELFAGRVSGLSTSSLKIQDDEGADPPADGDPAPSDTGGKTWSYTFGGADGFTPVDLSGTTIWQDELVTGGNLKVSLAKGKINIKPKIDAALLMGNLLPKSGKAVITTDVTGEIEFDADADGTFNLAKGDTLYSKKFGGLLSGPVGAGLPLTMQVDVKWSCNVGSTGQVHAAIGGTASGQLIAGAQFQGTSLSPIFPTPTYKLAPIGPSINANVTIKGACHLISTVALQVFDAAGPNATVDLYANVDVEGTGQDTAGSLNGSLTLGVQASAGGQLKPFGFSIATIQTDPFKFEKTFTSSIKLGQ